ncbi:2'-5' RNA ligase family protein [Pseudonocardia sp.]|uniref:2'-5' RNA ligase family protein n=1 Tax=Pseudonocardia sp. TaxID=60912 RepID=UPI003D0B1192
MTAFPPQPPADLDDPRAIADNDWAAFRTLDHMNTHWRRPGWTNGRRSYHWLLTFEEADELRDHVRRCQDMLSFDSLDPVRPETVHVTLGRVAFTDEVRRRDALAAADLAAPLLERVLPFTLQVGPPAGSQGAVRFSVSPWRPVLAVHELLATATRTVLGDRCVMATAELRPHISIAYANANLPTRSLVPALTAARALIGPRIRIDAVSLVELMRVDRSYRYERLRRVPLGGSP